MKRARRGCVYLLACSGSPSHQHEMSIRNALIGSPVERLEDLRFLRGRGEFVDDVPRPDALHAVFLRSPVAHGRIRLIDASAALQCRGVRAVLTAADILAEGLTEIPVITMRQELLP